MVNTSPGSQGGLRRANLGRVLAEVQAANGVTQAEIARRSGLSAATVTNLVRHLANSGTVVVADETRQGRRCRVVRMRLSDGHVLGVDLGRSHLVMCLATLDGQIVAHQRLTVAPDTSAEAGLDHCRAVYAELLAQANLESTSVLVAGVGVPGPLDKSTGHIGAGTLLPAWTGLHLKDAFEQSLGLPVVMDNDANIGALGEFCWRVEAVDPGPLIYLRLATGIGGGLLLGGQLHYGAAGTAGEVGHMTIDESGLLCRCGNRGCLETVAATPVMLQVLSSAIDRPADLDTWMDLCQAGNTAAARLVEAMGRHIGAAVANLCNLISPTRVVLGGPVTRAGDLLLAPVRDEVQRRAVPAAANAVSLGIARHGWLTEAHGAVVLALRQVGSERNTPSLLEG
jgi:predicted NBD/HSP70 family sugar kinase